MAASEMVVRFKVRPWWRLTKPLQYALVYFGYPVWVPKCAVKFMIIR